MTNENESQIDRLEAQCDRSTLEVGWGLYKAEEVDCPEPFDVNRDRDEDDDQEDVFDDDDSDD